MRTYRDRHRGARALVVGCGPSAKRAAELAPGYDLVVGVNAAARVVPEMTYLVLVDTPRLFWRQGTIRVVLETKAEAAFVASYSSGWWRQEETPWPVVRWLAIGYRPGETPLYEWDTFDDPHLPNWNGAPFAATALCCYLGCAEAHLIGVDMPAGHRPDWEDGRPQRAFGELAEWCGERGTRVAVCNGDSALAGTLPLVSETAPQPGRAP